VRDLSTFFSSLMKQMWSSVVFVAGITLVFQMAINTIYLKDFRYVMVLNFLLIIALIHVFKVRFEKVGQEEVI